MNLWNLHKIPFILAYNFVSGRSVLKEIIVFEVERFLLKVGKMRSGIRCLITGRGEGIGEAHGGATYANWE